MQVSFSRPIISTSSAVPKTSLVATPSTASLVKVSTDSSGPMSYRLDFSRITPRQLQALLDELTMNGNPDDFETAGDISVMLPCDWSSDDDTPMNLTADIEGARDWNRKYGEAKLADRLESLLGRMKVLEMRYTRISERA